MTAREARRKLGSRMSRKQARKLADRKRMGGLHAKPGVVVVKQAARKKK